MHIWSVRLERAAVVEAAVIGIPVPECAEEIRAVVIRAKGTEGSPEMAEELRPFVRKRLLARAYPRASESVEDLPMTLGPKVQRFILRKVEVEKTGRELKGLE